MAQTKNGAAIIAAKKLGITANEWLKKRDAGQKWCYCCESWKQENEFGRDESRGDGFASACKQCVSHKGTASRYGISVSEARQLRSGGRVCDICGRRQKLEVDHNHDTGAIRGVLCSRCNGALGQFRDNKNLLLKAIAYLEERDG